MLTHSVNWLAIVCAMIASMALGAAWYMVLGKQWMAALGRTREEIMAASGSATTPFIWAAAMQLVSAYFMYRFMLEVYGIIDVASGLKLAFWLWLGFVITSMITNHRYEGSKWSLALINGGYALGVLLIQGVVIGLFGQG